jgi:Sec-independent protein translocase protein TatA
MTTDLHKMAEQIADTADRIAAVADALQGKGTRRGGGAGRWWLLPGAGVVAVFAARKGPDLIRQARELVDQAKEQAASIGIDVDLLTKEGPRSENKQRNTSSSAKERSARSGRRQQRRKAT